MRENLIQLLAKVTLLLPFAAPAAYSLPTGNLPASAPPCEDFLHSPKLQGFESGTIEVPENWEQPEASPKIKVFYYWRKASAGNEAHTPVVFFNGGPSNPSHNAAELLAPLPFTQLQPIIFLDQRGTGCSTPYPEAKDEATALRLTRWGSRAIVADAEAVRTRLFGPRPWRAFGQSYGGLIVHRYLEIAPQGLERAISHGSAVMSDVVKWTAARVLSQKRVAEDFFREFPEDKAFLQKARGLVPAEMCWEQNSAKVCGPAVLDSFTILLGFQTSWYDLHLWIRSLVNEEGKLNKETLDNIVQLYVFGVYESGGLGHAVVSYVDLTPGLTDQESCEGALRLLQETGQDPLNFEINECRLLAAVQRADEGLLRRLPGDPVSLDALLANLQKGGPGLYLFAGAKDVFSPLELFAEETEKLGSLAHYKSFPESGHEGFYTEAEVAAAVTGGN